MRRPDDAAHFRRGVVALRVGVGVIWALNFLFVAWPANGFFQGFGATAESFEPTSFGGPTLAAAAAANAPWLAFVVAGVTAYLAVAFILGATTRVACGVGIAFNVVLLVTQFGLIVVVPGGTDVGPQPLYLLIYLILLIGHAESVWSVDARWRATRLQKAMSNPRGPAPISDT